MKTEKKYFGGKKVSANLRVFSAFLRVTILDYVELRGEDTENHGATVEGKGGENMAVFQVLYLVTCVSCLIFNRT